MEKPVGRVLVDGQWRDLWKAGFSAALGFFESELGRLKPQLKPVKRLATRANSLFYRVNDEDRGELDAARSLLLEADTLLHDVQIFERDEVVLFADRHDDQLQRRVEAIEAFAQAVADAVDLVEMHIADRDEQRRAEDEEDQ